MANFIGMVFATLKKEGIDTSNMDVDDAIAKYNEIKGGGDDKSTTGDESSKETTKQAEDGGNKPKGATEDERLAKILKERNQEEDADFAKDTDYFGYGSLDELEKAHNGQYGKQSSPGASFQKAKSDWKKEDGESWDDYNKRLDTGGKELSKQLKVGDTFLYTYKDANGKGYQETMKITKISKDGVEYGQDKHFVKKGEAICSYAGLYQFIGNGRFKFGGK